ncbi:MAG TPA: cytochrome-c oxidase [Thiotrichaceae bacterium]|nr:cytochrome-c oxidase [Thiotrichaceae bacterium]HIM08445.1 cytochrome-c oxidase [Gammaproteobacteria bacterium]
MTISLLFMGVIMGVVAWWLLKQTVDTSPWQADAPYAASEDFSGRSLPQPDAKLVLIIFLVVVTSLFALFISAYLMRMTMASDWRPLPDPDLLWLNTAVLILSSIALQWAHVAARREQLDSLRNGLFVGGFFAFVFIGGQLLAWQQLVDAGYYVHSNPANAFFYLITGLHALHLLGGVVAWGVTTIKLMGGTEVARLRLSVELCAIYWHFLLVVWLILFGLMLST